MSLLSHSYEMFLSSTTYVFDLAWALGIKVYASEIQPVPTRATVTSLAQSANCASSPSIHIASILYLSGIVISVTPY